MVLSTNIFALRSMIGKSKWLEVKGASCASSNKCLAKTSLEITINKDETLILLILSERMTRVRVIFSNSDRRGGTQFSELSSVAHLEAPFGAQIECHILREEKV